MATTDNSRELTRALRKSRAIMAARFALQRQLERIDYDLDVIQPALSDLKSDAAAGSLPAFEMEKLPGAALDSGE